MRTLSWLCVIVVLGPLASGCQSPEARVREHLVALEAETARLSWSCDALAQGLERWLDVHESELSDDVAALRESLDDAEDAEARAGLLAAASPPGRPEASEALARCGERADVQASLARLASLLEPLQDGEAPMPPPF